LSASESTAAISPPARRIPASWRTSSSEQSEIALGQALLQDILILFHDYERHIISRELAGDLFSDPAVAAQYVVAV
jgi:hypothetical protein